MHGRLLGGGTGTVDADVRTDQVGLGVLAGALVGRDQAAGASVTHLGVGEEVVLGIDRLGLVTAHSQVLGTHVGARVVLVAGVVRQLLLEAHVQGLALLLLLGGHPVALHRARPLRRGVALVEHVVHPALVQRVLGLQLVLVVGAEGALLVAGHLVVELAHGVLSFTSSDLLGPAWTCSVAPRGAGAASPAPGVEPLAGAAPQRHPCLAHLGTPPTGSRATRAVAYAGLLVG